ncbi:MAG: hypothetical protein IPM46_05695 [Flavobacteriales bacterium]|nr:hypothetical protein [Flavobacteriales bacterium]
MKRKLVISASTLFVGFLAMDTSTYAQDDGQVYKVIRLGGQQTASGYLISWLDITPDGSMIAATATQGFPLRFFPPDQPESTREIDVGNWYAGSRARYSLGGKYLVLQQLFYLDFAPNKDRPIKYEVVDAASGAAVRVFEDLFAASLTPDELTVVTLDNDGIHFVDLASGNKDNERTIQRTGNAVAVSPDGSRFAVAHRPMKTELEAIPALRNDKDAIKAGMKQGQIVIVYDMATRKPLFTLPELFDKVFRLEYSADQQDLWIHAKPHTRKGGNPNINQSYVEVSDAATGAMRRTSFPSLAAYEPDFRANPDGRLFAIGSSGGKYQEVHLYERATGRMVNRFVVAWRLWENLDKGEFASGDGRLSFCFLPDNRRMLLTSGNRLIEWTYAP